MTVCVATLADDGKTLVYAADKLIGTGIIETELEQEKILMLGDMWRVLISGNAVAPAFDIVDRAREKLQAKTAATLQAAVNAMEEAWAEKRLADAEAMFLRPRGMTVADFLKERLNSPDSASVQALDSRISAHEFPLHLLVAGFDNDNGRIFSLSERDRGVARRHDAPGFHAVGSGSVSAIRMMYFRELSPSMPARLALYYAFEAKYFGEEAPGVGWKTDLYIWRSGAEPQKIDLDVVEKVLVNKLVNGLQPKNLRVSHVEILNKRLDLPGIDSLVRKKKGKDWIIERQKSGPE